MRVFGVWMWPDSLLENGVEKTFDMCARAGVTDVYLLTKGLNGSTIFPYAEAKQTVLGRDLLQEALEAAHSRGQRLHAWFTSAGDAAYAAAYPERALYHYLSGPHARIVSITDCEYQRYMCRIIRHMVKHYAVDGLHLDYIRYNSVICGWSKEDMARYAAYGVDIGRIRHMMDKTFVGDHKDEAYIFNRYRCGDRDVHLLAEARRLNVRVFARLLSDAAREERPNITISAALMPEGAYDDLAFSDLHYGQHYTDMADIVDVALPMAYSCSYHEDEQWVAMVTRGTMQRGLHIVTGIHAFDGGTGLSVQKDVAAAENIKGADGVCLFREGAVCLAWQEAGDIALYNPTKQKVTSLLLHGKSEMRSVEVSVEAGQKARLPAAFEPSCIQAFAGGKELPVYLRTNAET